MIEALEGELADRMCVVTREVKEEGDLIRFARSPQGEAVPDLQRRLPGRGVWVSLKQAAVAEAVRKKLFARGFGEATEAPADLVERLRHLLWQQALSYLSLAKKAGEAVSGAAKVEDMLGSGRARLLIHAREASLDGARKIDRLATHGEDIITSFAGPEMDLALGRANVIHAAVAKGGLAEKLLVAARRAEAYDA